MQKVAYIKSSDAVLKWNQDLSSSGSDESVSMPLTNSMFPKWRVAATTRKIASCRWSYYQYFCKVTRYPLLNKDRCYNKIPVPVLQNWSQQYP